MPKTKKTIQDIKGGIELSLRVISILAIALGFYITLRLAPISERVSLNTQSIETSANKLNRLEDNLATKDDIVRIEKRLERIDNILDAHLGK